MSALRSFLALADDEDPWLPSIAIKPAAERPPPACMHTAPASVFHLASRPVQVKQSRCKVVETQRLKVSGCTRAVRGVTRIEGAAYPSRWTAEDYKREEQRRARQVPPRPSKGARSKGQKLRELLGQDAAGGS